MGCRTRSSTATTTCSATGTAGILALSGELKFQDRGAETQIAPHKGFVQRHGHGGAILRAARCRSASTIEGHIDQQLVAARADAT